MLQSFIKVPNSALCFSAEEKAVFLALCLQSDSQQTEQVSSLAVLPLFLADRKKLILCVFSPEHRTNKTKQSKDLVRWAYEAKLEITR